MEELSAQGNCLTSIPDDVGEMRRLVRLNVAENKLSSLPKGLGDAAMMTTLWCYGNPELRSLPMSLAKNVSLKSVWCEGCDALEGDGVRELVEALPTRKGGVAATIGLDLAQCTRAGLKIRPATTLDANAAGGLACDHPHVAVSEMPGAAESSGEPIRDESEMPGGYSRGYFKHVRWTEGADAPVLIVAFGSAPGVPNWGGLLRKLRRDLLARGVACAGGRGPTPPPPWKPPPSASTSSTSRTSPGRGTTAKESVPGVPPRTTRRSARGARGSDASPGGTRGC